MIVRSYKSAVVKMTVLLFDKSKGFDEKRTSPNNRDGHVLVEYEIMNVFLFTFVIVDVFDIDV